MTSAHWYELRVAGSPGTAAGSARSKEGIAVSESGRLCTVSSGKAMRFGTKKLALNYLTTQSTPGRYRFEIVRCPTAVAGDTQSPAITASI